MCMLTKSLIKLFTFIIKFLTLLVTVSPHPLSEVPKKMSRIFIFIFSIFLARNKEQVILVPYAVFSLHCHNEQLHHSYLIGIGNTYWANGKGPIDRPKIPRHILTCDVVREAAEFFQFPRSHTDTTRKEPTEQKKDDFSKFS